MLIYHLQHICIVWHDQFKSTIKGCYPQFHVACSSKVEGNSLANGALMYLMSSLLIWFYHVQHGFVGNNQCK